MLYNNILYPFCFLFVFLQILLQIPAVAQSIEEKPYLITLSVTDGSVSNFGIPDSQAIMRTEVQMQIEKTIKKTVEYCRIFAGTRWNVIPQYPDEKLNGKIVPADIDWNKVNADKLFLVSLNYDSGKIDNFSLQEIDVQLRKCGIKKHYRIDSLEKLPDLLFQALLKHFSLLAIMENSTPQSAVFKIQGSGIPELSAASLPSFPAGSILIPFVRTLDREGSTVSVEPVPYTFLIAETTNTLTQRLTCRIVSGLPNALSAKRRGRTEIFAAGLSSAEQEEMKSTLLKVQLPNSAKSIPVYDIYEVFQEDNKVKDDRNKTVKTAAKIGRSSIDGIFELPAEPDKLLRVIQIRSGNSLFAQFPVVRSLQNEITVPIADAPVRLEAESYLKGLQDEFIDTLAKRIILQKRLEKIEQKTEDSGNAERKLQNEIMNLKNRDGFLNGLEQGRQRFRSDIPAVQYRIDRMFRETEKAFKQHP
ncbi:hypothetical protein FACS18942_05570 [Planctomycetales bacterium]|nr:hypothetical protein FACS18942_05570 [Planctomycetales bacterium]GHT35430.1 hypothetical protein FACS189427_04680 [Planctomycetales bacterium]